MASGLKQKLSGLRYERLNAHWEIAECEYRAQGWPQPRRCIVARRPAEETEPQPTLFTLQRYAYRAWITNLPLTPAGVWHFYDGRAGMERRIRELREDFAFRKIPTRAFAANALYLEVVRMAYNLGSVAEFVGKQRQGSRIFPAERRELALPSRRSAAFNLVSVTVG